MVNFVMEKKGSFPALALETVFHVFKTIPDGIVVLNRGGAPVFVNPAAEEILQSGQDGKNIYQSLSQILGFDPLNLSKRTKKEIFIQGSPYSVWITPLFEGRKGHTKVLLFFQDISLFKQAEELKADFMSIASHELRNPLTAVKNSLEILFHKKAGGINAKQEEFLTIAMRNVERIASLVNEYLDLSKIELGRMPFQFRNLQIKDIVKNIVESFIERAEEKKITLKQKFPHKLPQVIADPVRVEEIFSNLLDNAIKYSDKGSSITISAREIKQGKGRASRSVVETCVADTGPGIPEEKRELIFEKFYRLDKSMEREKNGAGLGLAIVKKLIERHGGEIRVVKNKPVGSKFCFTLLTCKSERRDIKFRQIFDREFERARKNHYVLSILAILISNFAQIKKQIGRLKAETILTIIESATKESLYRQADTFVHHKRGEIFVVFCETEKKGAHIICKRIKRNIKKVASTQNEAIMKSVDIRLGVATYPEDALSQRDLFRLALKHARR